MADNPSVDVPKKKYKIKVDRDKCIGAASCVGISPTSFQLDDQNKAIVISEDADTAENILLAAQSCPTKAILIFDENDTPVWPK